MICPQASFDIEIQPMYIIFPTRTIENNIQTRGQAPRPDIILNHPRRKYNIPNLDPDIKTSLRTDKTRYSTISCTIFI